MSIFVSNDPLLDLFPNQSSYVYAYNNPVRFIDIDGLYGNESEATAQKNAAIERGFNVGEIYKSGDEWGFNVMNGEDSYSVFNREFSSEPQYTNIRNNLSLYGTGRASNSNSDAATIGVNLSGIANGFANDFYSSMSSYKSGGGWSKVTGNYIAKNNKIYSWAHHPNGATGKRVTWMPQIKSGTHLATNQTKIMGLSATKGLGIGLGALSAGMTINQWNQGKMSNVQFGMEMGVTGVSMIPNPYTMAIGIGWEMGRAITNIPAYRRRVHPYEFNNIYIPTN